MLGPLPDQHRRSRAGHIKRRAANVWVLCRCLEGLAASQRACGSEARTRGWPRALAEIDPEIASRIARAQEIATSPQVSVWDRRSGFITEVRRAEAHRLRTYDRLISQQVTCQAPEPVPVPQTVVRQTTR